MEGALRVGLNLIFLGERAGGAGRYARELPGALLRADPSLELHVFVSRDLPAELRRQSWAGEVRWVHCPVGLRDQRSHLVFQFTVLPMLAAARRLDVLHSLANLGPAVTPRVASVISLLDVIWMRPPQQWGGTLRGQRSLRRFVEHDVRHAARIFAISEAAASDLTSLFGVSRERISVTPLGVDPPSVKPASDSAVRLELQLGGGRVLLSVAQKHPYKNLQRLIRALPDLDEDVVLVLPGSPTPHEDELKALAQELEVADRVYFPGWLSDEQLEGLYAIASAVVLPSLIEGFGLPAIEAMLRGVPLASSNAPALAEVAGDAALIFDPQSQEDATAAIRRLLEDPELARGLALRGRERAARFTWEQTAQSSLEGYLRAIAARATPRRPRAARGQASS
jgi:glycosyltransferase involved in cell wall biosynthesis